MLLLLVAELLGPCCRPLDQRCPQKGTMLGLTDSAATGLYTVRKLSTATSKSMVEHLNRRNRSAQQMRLNSPITLTSAPNFLPIADRTIHVSSFVRAYCHLYDRWLSKKTASFACASWDAVGSNEGVGDICCWRIRFSNILRRLRSEERVSILWRYIDWKFERMNRWFCPFYLDANFISLWISHGPGSTMPRPSASAVLLLCACFKAPSFVDSITIVYS